MPFHFTTLLQIALNIGILVSLFLFLVQDVKYRAISWLLFPGLWLILVLYRLLCFPLNNILYNYSLNLGFIFIQLALLLLYFSLRNKQLVNIMQSHLGWGDVLFWVAVAVFLTPVNFILFFFSSLVFSLLIYSFLPALKVSKTIPLAGLQALFLFMLIITDEVTNKFHLYDDRGALRVMDKWLLS